MVQGLQDWSLTAGSNASSDDNINWREGQLGPTVNNSARAMMAATRAFLNTLAGGATYGGSSNAYTVTNDTVGAWVSYAAPRIVMLKANHTNSAAATVNVDGLGAKSIKTGDGGDVIAGDIVSGGLYLLAYDGTNFQILNSIAGGSFQPLDATTTAFSALAGTAGDMPYWTGTDAFALVASTTAGRTVLSFVDPNADRILFWDDSAGAVAALALGTGISITGTQMDLSAALLAWESVTPGTGVTTFLTTPSSANLKAAVTDETGSGALVFATSPTLVTPILGTPTSGNLLNCSGYTAANLGGLGTGVGDFLGTPSSANLLAAITDETGTGALVFGTSPTLTTPTINGGTIQSRVQTSSESSGVLTSASVNKTVQCAAGITLPSSGLTDGDIILIDPRGTARTITRPVAHSMMVYDTDSATATTAAYNIVVAMYHGSSIWTLDGAVS